MTLSWVDNSNNEDGFSIERSVDGATYAEIGSVGANATTYVDSTVAEGQDYAFRVRAYNSAGYSDYSNVATGSIVTITNNAPTISSVADVSAAYGEAIAPITFSIDDLETSASSLGVTIESSNQNLLPSANMTVSGTGTERVLELSPAADQWGSSTVTLTVGDGSATTSASFNLSVESPPALVPQNQITVLQEPVSQTINRQDSVLLSVSAEGSNLSYQWYLGETGDTTKPIIGATGSDYQTDVLSQTTTFWVEIKSGDEVRHSESVIVAFAPQNTYYFGSVAGGEGSFGLMVRSDNTAVIIAYDKSIGLAVESSDLKIAADDTFAYEGNGETILSGRIDGSNVSGSVATTGRSFSGTQSSIDGPTSPYSGFYYSVLSNTSDGQVLLIAGPDGRGMATVSLGASVSGATALVKNTGSVTATLDNGSSLSLSIDKTKASLSGKLRLGSYAYTVTGQREDKEASNALVNTSIRTPVNKGASAGFTISGTGQTKVLIRGVGPSLEKFGVPDAVSDSRIVLYREGELEPFAENDDWSASSNAAEVAASAQLVGAFPFANGSKDAALLLELPAGNYTAYVSSVNGSQGTVLIEAYDVNEAEGVKTSSTLSSISLRGEVGAGDDVIIAGFVVAGDAPKRFLVRAMGSELEQFGITGTLSDPKLTIYRIENGQETVVVENDNWQEDRSVVRSITNEVGAFAFNNNSKSSGQVVWLDPGVYTAIASSADGISTGIALVEVYEAP